MPAIAYYRMPAHTNNPPAQHDHHHDTPNGISRPPAHQHLGLARQDSPATYIPLPSTQRCASAFTTYSSRHARTPWHTLPPHLTKLRISFQPRSFPSPVCLSSRFIDSRPAPICVGLGTKRFTLIQKTLAAPAVAGLQWQILAFRPALRLPQELPTLHSMNHVFLSLRAELNSRGFVEWWRFPWP
jgi:hypothetical protein